MTTITQKSRAKITAVLVALVVLAVLVKGLSQNQEKNNVLNFVWKAS